MAVKVNLGEARTRCSELLQRVTCGEEGIIADGDQPVARLVPFHAPRTPRVPGRYAGQIRIDDDVDAPLHWVDDAEVPRAD